MMVALVSGGECQELKRGREGEGKRDLEEKEGRRDGGGREAVVVEVRSGVWWVLGCSFVGLVLVHDAACIDGGRWAKRSSFVRRRRRRARVRTLRPRAAEGNNNSMRRSLTTISS